MTTTAKENTPTHRVYLVKGESDQAHWTAIGGAWAHRDGKGFSIQLHAIPLQGRIVMREIGEASNEAGGQS